MKNSNLSANNKSFFLHCKCEDFITKQYQWYIQSIGLKAGCSGIHLHFNTG